ncbi:MAG: calcium-binding protein [Methylovulum sp.]|uniref:calcium-binding protein n=1 Tax=Methylovulum sp. TaxID=1916980 RepID=UPI002635E8A2|nr:calcium-binding protein [Methylovulum sp.]MDD2723765.1 calcium-binding protein [Methylovulum sp.]MDD5123621.1 calcium-binding protein [Methylovulum sp.]
MATITGTEGNDILQGLDGESNTINGLGGNDNIYGGNLADTLLGGDGADDVWGGDGDDIINGGAGDDSGASAGLSGANGADTYLFANGDGDDIIYNINGNDDGGKDVVKFTNATSTEVGLSRSDYDLILSYGAGDRITISYYFPVDNDYYAAERIDQFQFSDGVIWTWDDIKAKALQGTEGDDYLRGYDGESNTINGLGGDDEIIGGNLADTLLGGDGWDSIDGGDGDDTISGGDGWDYSIDGGDGDDTISGGEGSDVIFGGNGHDLINGGKGDDDRSYIPYHSILSGGLSGGAGSDTYVFAKGDGADVINDYDGELPSDQGVNIIQFTDVALTELTGIGFYDSDYPDVYFLTISYGSSDQVSISGYFGVYSVAFKINQVQFSDGATLDNFIIGTNPDGTTANDGLSGTGTMTGGLGDDLYFVDDAGDVVTEATSSGKDTVISTINYTLTANVENLALTGNAAINAKGNALANVLTGNSAVNRLDGGTGADSMAAGDGNDFYVVDNLGDVVTELAGGGEDMVISYVSFSLGGFLENLKLSGNKVINGTGNGLNNVLAGNAKANILNGGGGADVLNGGDGLDVLIGGLGKDKINLKETTAATDTVKMLAGDSLTNAHDTVSAFSLGNGVSAAATDRLDLDNTTIAANVVAADGVNVGIIKSHAISNGIVSFDDVNSYSAPLTLTAGNLGTAFKYLQANFSSGETVAFIAVGNTYVFQDNGSADTAVQLAGVLASNLDTDGLAAGGVWLV